MAMVKTTARASASVTARPGAEPDAQGAPLPPGLPGPRAQRNAAGSPDGSADNRSLARGIELLRAFRPGAESLSNGELAERCGLSRATVSRLTQTLLRCGFLEHDPHSRLYRLGAPVLSLAHARRSGSTVLQVAAEPMRLLSESARINVGIALADREDMVYLESIRYQRRAAQRRVVAGQRVPMELTALGHAWLAASPQARPGLYRAFAARRGNWPALRREIHAAITDVAARGWCWACWQPEVLALATPMHLPGQPVHVLNVSTTTRLDPRTLLPELAPLLMRLATEICESFAALGRERA